LLYYHLREKGLHIREGFPCFLTTAHTDGDIDSVIRAFKESIAAMQEGGFLPDPGDSPHSAKPPVGNAERGAQSAKRCGSEAPALTRSAFGGPLDRELPEEVPLTESQMEIWLSARLSDEASCAYNESLTLQMRGDLNHSALRRAIKLLVDRHDAL